MSSASRRRFGHVRKLPSGRYQASYIGPDGARHMAPSTFGKQTDAARWLALAESEILRGTWRDADAGKMTVGQWAATWMAAAEPQLKRTTVSTYRGVLKLSILPQFGDRPLRDVRPIEVGQWMAAMVTEGKSPSWVGKAYRLRPRS